MVRTHPQISPNDERISLPFASQKLEGLMRDLLKITLTQRVVQGLVMIGRRVYRDIQIVIRRLASKGRARIVLLHPPIKEARPRILIISIRGSRKHTSRAVAEGNNEGVIKGITLTRIMSLRSRRARRVHPLQQPRKKSFLVASS